MPCLKAIEMTKHKCSYLWNSANGKKCIKFWVEDLGWYAEILLKIVLQFLLGKNKNKIELEDHAKLSAYWPEPWLMYCVQYLNLKALFLELKSSNPSPVCWKSKILLCECVPILVIQLLYARCIWFLPIGHTQWYLWLK